MTQPQPIDPATLEIADMQFSNKVVGTRIRNILAQYQVKYLADLLKLSEADLLDMRNFGAVSLAELTVKLRRMGFELRTEQRW